MEISKLLIQLARRRAGWKSFLDTLLDNWGAIGDEIPMEIHLKFNGNFNEIPVEIHLKSR